MKTKIYMLLSAIVLSALLSEAFALPGQTAGLTMEAVSMSAGAEQDGVLVLDNPDDLICNMNFELVLPAGVEVVSCAPAGNRTSASAHVVRYNEKSTGRIAVTYLSDSNTPFSGNTGPVLTVRFRASKGMASGSYSIGLENVVLSRPDASTIYCKNSNVSLEVEAGVLFASGDANGDGNITVSDFTAIANHILGNTSASFVESAADVNQDGGITVSDLTGVANIILYGSPTGASLVAPMPEEHKSNAVSENKSSKGCIGGKQYIAQ